jgi:hypothetical protein
MQTKTLWSYMIEKICSLPSKLILVNCHKKIIEFLNCHQFVIFYSLIAIIVIFMGFFINRHSLR